MSKCNNVINLEREEYCFWLERSRGIYNYTFLLFMYVYLCCRLVESIVSHRRILIPTP